MLLSLFKQICIKDKTALQSQHCIPIGIFPNRSKLPFSFPIHLFISFFVDEVKQKCLESSDQVVGDSGVNPHHQSSTHTPTQLPKVAHKQKLPPTSLTKHRGQKQESYWRPEETVDTQSYAAILQINLILTCICTLIIQCIQISFTLSLDIVPS